MFTKFLALFAFVAAANAGLVYPETRIESFPVTKTTITGPSGEIKQEEHRPVVAHEPLVEAPLAPLAPVVVPEIHHGEPLIRFVRPVVHEEKLPALVEAPHAPLAPLAPLPVLPPFASLQHEVFPSEFVLPAEHEAPYFGIAKPIIEEPALRLVKPIVHGEHLVRLVNPIEHSGLFVNSLPYSYPLNTPFRSIYRGNYFY